MKLSVIIVNYNVQYFLEQALLSVGRASLNLDVEVFVVDNNSVDDSVKMVKEKFPKVHLIANRNNPGFSIANNQAIRMSKGEYILLLNPDTVIEEDTLDKCVAFMDAHPNAGGLGVKMIDGSGNFLPESKRGFPSPYVAFCKTFGLSKIFPKSKKFNQYHLGYLDQNENHQVDVLAGAFMMLRKSVLDEIGLLDEIFFMYGEDIDLSYRIVKAGYQNYYFSETTIIHYKGESTKKGSLNYVKTFYNAMILFARKHFKGEKAWLFILMLQAAIYFRASLTLITNFLKKIYLLVLDAFLIFVGMYYLKNFWSTYYFGDSNYYLPSFMYFNVPLYIGIWITAIYFSGGYDTNTSIRKSIRGVLAGTVLLAAVYGFLDLEYRSSRTLIILGAIWAILSSTMIRFLFHFIRYGNFQYGREKMKNLIIVGSKEESKRVLDLVYQAQAHKNFIGTVAPGEKLNDPETYLSTLDQLDEVVHIYKIDEIIFCSENISAQSIMKWMTRLGSNVEYKIVPQKSISIIGSSSKNKAGELYTIDIQFLIASHQGRRNKRLTDLLLSLCLLAFSPLLLLFVKKKINFIANIFKVLWNKKTWVGYAGDNKEQKHLPSVKNGVLTPLDALKLNRVNKHTIQRLNFLYAKDYKTSDDWDIVWKGLKEIGR